MSNTFATLANSAALLKSQFEGPVVTQFNDEFPFYKQIEKGKEKWSGLDVKRSLKVRRNPGIGATSDGGNLPSIGKQTTAQATITAKQNYLRFGLTAGMLKSAQGDKSSFATIMEFEMDQGMTDLKDDVDRQMLWDGTSDLATVAANVAASNVVTVTGRESTEDGNKFLDIGIKIDIYTAAGALVQSGLVITDLSGTTTATLTLDQVVTSSATDIVVRSGTFGNELSGLLYTLDGSTTSTIYGLSRSTYPVLQGNVVNAQGGQMTLDLLKQAHNQGRQRGGAKYDYIVCDYDTERFYEKLLIMDKRYMGKVKGDGTFSDKEENYLEYSGRPVVVAKNASRGFNMIDSSTWKKYVLSELEWADETGTYFISQTDVDAWEIRLRLFADIFCEKPSANARLRNYISP